MYTHLRNSIPKTNIERHVDKIEYDIAKPISNMLESQHDIEMGYPTHLNPPELYAKDFFQLADENPSLALRQVNKHVFGSNSFVTNGSDDVGYFTKIFNSKKFVTEKRNFVEKLHKLYPNTIGLRGVLLSLNRIGNYCIEPKMTAIMKQQVKDKLKQGVLPLLKIMH